MSIVISLLLYFVILILSFLIFRVFRLNVVGIGAHPIGLLIIVQFFTFSLPGVLLVSFGGFESARYMGISAEKLHEIGLWYLYSYFVFLIFLCIYHKLGGASNYNRNLGSENSNKMEISIPILLFLSVAIFFIKIAILGETPLIMALRGEVYRANILRTEFQNNLSANQIPYIEPLFDFILVFQCYFIFYMKFVGRRVSVLILFVSFSICAHQLTFDLQKYKLLLLMISLVFMYSTLKGIGFRVVVYGVMIFLSSILLYSIFMGSDSDIIFTIIERVFVIQNQGFYNIINYITPHDKYMWDGFYFVGRLGINVERADVDIVPYIYGDFTNVVNSNSYYLGQAWSQFGHWGLLISPFIVSLATCIFIKIIDLLVKYDHLYFIPFLFYFVPGIKINQSFSYFLFGKQFVTVLIMAVFTYFLLNLIQRFTAFIAPVVYRR